MSIEKVYFETDGNHVNMSVPISKIDKENRIVSGFASLDNVDKHGDIVTAEATMQAFKDFRGNIREMHDKHKAVGRMVKFSQEPFYDAKTGETHNGVYVSVRISKGAEDTWEKVLDGTLSGFSIGATAETDDMETSYSPDIKKSIRIVHKMNMQELSLVDNPANPLANILTISKNADGQTEYSGMLAEARAKNVFWCDKNKLSVTSDDDTNSCPICHDEMTNVGFIEESDDTNQQQADLAELVTKYLSEGQVANEDKLLDNNKDNLQTQDEGGARMGDTTATATDETTKVVDETKNEDGTTETQTTTETVSEETQTTETGLTLEQVKEVVREVLAEATLSKSVDTPEAEGTGDATDPSAPKEGDANAEGEANAVRDNSDGADDANSEADESQAEDGKNDELLSKMVDTLNDLVKVVNGLSTAREEDVKRIESVVKSTAIKKSGDLESPEKIEKNESSWGGTFSVLPSIRDITTS